MGRLVLNVLLSFAQFEREIIAERTRDKIAAARRKGKWSGGKPILGYDVDPRTFKLVVNEAEAASVRAIFELYLRARTRWRRWCRSSTPRLDQQALDDPQGTRTRRQALHQTSLHKLLTNVAYLGKVRYKDEVHPGEHTAILEEALWQRVQDRLRQNGRTCSVQARNRYGALLKGLLYCESCGSRLTPTQATKNARCYRYYRCMRTSHAGASCPARFIPAPPIEAFVVERIRTVAKEHPVDKERITAPRNGDPEIASSLRCLLDTSWSTLAPQEQGRVVRLLIDRVNYNAATGNVAIRLLPHAASMLAQVRTQNEDIP